MLSQISKWIDDFVGDDNKIPCGDLVFAETVAALLVEGAMVDGQMEDSEKTRIVSLLNSQLDLEKEEAILMIERQVLKHDSRIELHSLLRDIRSDTSLVERTTILEMVWTVVLSDGYVDKHESQLMRRLAGLLYVDDVTSGMAQKRARRNLGMLDC